MQDFRVRVRTQVGNLVQRQEDAPFGMTAKYMNYVLMTIQMQDFHVRVRTQDFSRKGKGQLASKQSLKLNTFVATQWPVRVESN